MAIFAVKNVFEKLVLITSPKNGDLLVYDSNKGAFVNVSSSQLNLSSIPTLDFRSVSGNNSVSLIERTSGNSVEFRSLIGKNGILITESSGNIIVQNTNNFSSIFSRNSYSIVIDYDDDNSNSYFTVDTVDSTSSKNLTISSLPEFNISSYELVNSSSTSFLISTFNFAGIGFEKQMLITLSSTPGNLYDGVYQIQDIDVIVSASSIQNRIDLGKILVSSSSIGIPLSNVRIRQVGIYASTSGNFFVSGYSSSKPFFLNIWKGSSLNFTDFPSGVFITLNNSEKNIIDSNYIVASSKDGSFLGNKWLTLLLNQDTPLPLDISGDISFTSNSENFSISILGNIVNTGFKVSKTGTVYGNKFVMSALPTSSDVLANKAYVDMEISNLIDVHISALNSIVSANIRKINNLEKVNKKTFRMFMQYSRH
jgi:hypothetical protein